MWVSCCLGTICVVRTLLDEHKKIQAALELHVAKLQMSRASCLLKMGDDADALDLFDA